MAVPCVPEDAVAKKILDSCAASFAANCGDCNHFLKAALSAFLNDGYFEGLNADGIVGKLQLAEEGWGSSRQIATAIVMAKSGHVVVAGMTAARLGQHHGHVAVVVGCDGQRSDDTTVPIGYAGSLDNPAARIEGARLSGTFAATLVRSESIDYYFKVPDRIPA